MDKSANSVGEPPTGSVPCCFSPRELPHFNAAFAAADNFSMIGGRRVGASLSRSAGWEYNIPSA